jgi:hypothetical protein
MDGLVGGLSAAERESGRVLLQAHQGLRRQVGLVGGLLGGLGGDP